MLEFIQIPPGCPYHGFATSIDLTCEEGLCSWLRQPSNVFSSLCFFIPALYIVYQSARQKLPQLQLLGIITVFIGLSSVLAHATHLKVFGFADFTFQFLMILVLIWLNLSRTSKKIPIPLWHFSSVLWLLSATVQWFFTLWSLYIYAILFMILLATELFAYRETRKGNYKSYFTCAFVLLLGFIAFYLDAARMFCDPDDHIFQWHAIWHILSAISLFYLFDHYRQFAKPIAI